MIWIVSKGVIGNNMERKSRLQFIKDVTGDERAFWKKLSFKNGNHNSDFYFCVTNDGVRGVFITAHNTTVRWLCELEGIAYNDFIVANTCMVVPDFDKEILQQMLYFNNNVQLYYAKQRITYIDSKNILNPNFIDSKNVFKTNYIDNVGTFGFKTSKSERILYYNRKYGIKNAIQRAFDRVQINV